jgi:hypothetical protein
MYALIHDEQLILGPIKYNYVMINYELEELEINARLNSNSYIHIPIQFDEKTFLLPAREVYPDYDGRTQKLSSSVWTIEKREEIPAEVVFTYSSVDKDLDEIKSEIKMLVAPERWNRENTTITLTIQGVDISVSTSRENRLSLATKLLSSSSSHNFKFGENLWLEITQSDLQQIIQSIDNKVQEAFDWELAKLQEIDSCTTINDVLNVEIVPPRILPVRE